MRSKKLDTSVIPYGDYCYTCLGIVDDPVYFKRMETKCCPYWEIKKINGVTVYFCEFTKDFDYCGNPSLRKVRKYEKKMIQYYRTKRKMIQAYRSGFLLFDQCKSCGENNYPDEDYLDKNETV